MSLCIGDDSTKKRGGRIWILIRVYEVIELKMGVQLPSVGSEEGMPKNDNEYVNNNKQSFSTKPQWLACVQLPTFPSHPSMHTFPIYPSSMHMFMINPSMHAEALSNDRNILCTELTIPIRCSESIQGTQQCYSCCAVGSKKKLLL